MHSRHDKVNNGAKGKTLGKKQTLKPPTTSFLLPHSAIVELTKNWSSIEAAINNVAAK